MKHINIWGGMNSEVIAKIMKQNPAFSGESFHHYIMRIKNELSSGS